MAVEERIYRFARDHGPVEPDTIASALDALRATLSGVEVAALVPHPLARDLIEAAKDPEGDLASERELDPRGRAKIVASLAEDVRSRAGRTPGYLDFLRPFFSEVLDPRPSARSKRRGGLWKSEGGIIVP
jgi:hypothetical protein